MKLQYRFILLALVAGFIFGQPPQAAAQAGDELLVLWDADGDLVPNLNALRDAIANDTNRPAGRVYKLQRGGFYWNPDVIDNVGFHLRIVGETPGTTADAGPAVLQNVANATGFVSARMFGGQSSLTLKNLYIMGQNDLGDQGTRYQPCQVDASDARFVIEGCIFERSNFAIMAFTGRNNDIFFRNNVFRNLVGSPVSQQWEGRGVSIWADQDTVVVENNTFFNIHFTPFQLEQGSANYLLFNHNTLVNFGRNLIVGNWYQEAYFANNLIYNGFWHSEGTADFGPGRDPRATVTGLWSIAALPSKYGPELGRKIVFTNTSAWLTQRFVDYHAANSLSNQPFINRVTKEDFLDLYDAMVIQDTLWADPGLATTTPEIYDAMIAAIEATRAGQTGVPYFWKIPEDAPGTLCHTCPSWPLPENFSYTNTQLRTAGTDGLPLGDLNWFPTQKAQFDANRDQYIAAIHDIGPKPPSFEVRGTVEAEVGALAGDAVIEPFQGFSYYQMDGGGYMEWTFNLPQAGVVDLLVSTHLRGNSDRGQRILVNTTDPNLSLRNNSGYGEYFWSSSLGDPTNEWFTTTITQAGLLAAPDGRAERLDLPAGQNFIRISSSWGYQHFSGIDIRQGGVTVLQLKAPDVTAHDLVIPVGEGKPWTPSEFKSVALNTNGSVSWNFNVPATGQYRLRVFYQNYSGPQTGQLQVDGSSVGSVNFNSNTDSTGLDLLTDPAFTLTAGSHAVTLSGNQLRVDYVQLIEEIRVSVSERNNVPLGYGLAQNYPNPFNPTTTINFALGNPSQVKLTVFNVLGQKVATLLDSRMDAGSHTVQFDARRLTSGVYFYRLEAGDFELQKRMLLIK